MVSQRTRLGIHLGSQAAATPDHGLRLASLADDLGLDSIWTSEAYGSDCLTPLASYQSRTTRVRPGTGILQISARTRASVAMATAALSRLPNVRFVLGIGASGPQVVEGWYGQEFARTLARSREFIEIIRTAISRDVPSCYKGRHYRLPRSGGTGLGKAIRLSLGPQHHAIPIVLAAEGPKNISLAAEIADGWMLFLYSLQFDGYFTDLLEEGRAKRDPSLGTNFQVISRVHVAVDPSIEVAADKIRPTLALYIGGMFAKEANFHANVFRSMGYEQEVDTIQDLYLRGEKEDAIKAVSTRMVEEVSLVGPIEKVHEDLTRWKDSMLDVMLVDASEDVVAAISEGLEVS